MSHTFIWSHFSSYNQMPGPKVIKLLSCSTQLRLKFILLINVKMPIDIRHPSQESFARKQRNAPFRGFGGFGVPQSTPIHATSSTRNRDGHDSGSPRDMETDAAVVDINESRSESVNDAAKEVTRAQPTSDTNPSGACGTAADFKTPNSVTNTKQQHERSSGTGSRASSRSRSRSRSRSVSLSRPIGGENPTAQHQDPNTTDG